MKLRCTVMLLACLGGAPLLPAAVPRSLDEAEAFGRRLVQRQLYEQVGLVQRESADRIAVRRDPAGTWVALQVPRAMHTGPGFEITLRLRPHDGLIGHLRTHQALQNHRLSDYPSTQDTAVQMERYERAVSPLGPRAACVHVQVEKSRTAKVAVVSHLELNWLPTNQPDFHVQIVAGNFQLNLPRDGHVGSEAVHLAVDKIVATLLRAVLQAADEQGLVPAEVARETTAYCDALGQLPHLPPDSPRFLGPATTPPAMTLAAITVAPEPVAPPVSTPSLRVVGVRSAPTRSPPPPSANAPIAPEIIRLAPAEVLDLCQSAGLAELLPNPVPTVSAVPPTLTPPMPVGVRGVGRGPAGSAFSRAMMLGLLFKPDARLLVLKEDPASRVTLYAHLLGDWAAVVLETEGGWHLPLIVPRPAFPAALAGFLKLGAPVAETPTLRLNFSPSRVLLLRALFELQQTMRPLAGTEAVRLSGFAADEITRLYSSPRFMALLEPLPETSQSDVLIRMGNPLLTAVELAALGRQRLVTRLTIDGQPRYILSRDGERVARLAFAPHLRLRITRIPGAMKSTVPVIDAVHAIGFAGSHSAQTSFLPDGTVLYRESPWLGGDSLSPLIKAP